MNDGVALYLPVMKPSAALLAQYKSMVTWRVNLEPMTATTPTKIKSLTKFINAIININILVQDRELETAENSSSTLRESSKIPETLLNPKNNCQNGKWRLWIIDHFFIST